MTRRNSKRHLEFDSLEAVELLSGAGMALPHAMIHHPATQAHRASRHSVGDVALNLSGTATGTYLVMRGGSGVSITGRGTITPIGKTIMHGRVAINASGNTGQFTLNAGKRGKITATITGQTPGGGYNYQITGGTKSFAGDTGSGVAVVQILSSNPAQTRGRIAVSFQGATAG
jgi:hypothetical protein